MFKEDSLDFGGRLHSSSAYNKVNHPLEIRQNLPGQNRIVQSYQPNLSITNGNQHRIVQSPTMLASSGSVQNTELRGSGNQKMPRQIRQSIVKFTYSMNPVVQIEGNGLLRRLHRGLSFKCDICLMEYPTYHKVQFAKCGHSFCDSCLRHYAEYKISRFEQILCPTGDCPECVDTTSPFFLSLSPELRAKYKKVQVFAMVMKNPHLRMCPSEKCNDGVMDLSKGSAPQCDKCGVVYCAKCFYPQHAGTCDQTELEFFQNNFKFRQCARCKNVIEKADGCNHISCRCGYQFCYLCGGHWRNNNHICGQADIPFNILDDRPPARNRHQAVQRALLLQPPPPPPYQRPLIVYLCIILFKVLIILPLTFILIILWVAIRLLVLAMIVLILTIKGLFCGSYQLIRSMEFPLNVLLLVLFPVAMVWGVVKSLRQQLSPITHLSDLPRQTYRIFENCVINSQL